MDTIELAGGGILLYDDAFLSPNLAERYFVELRDTAPWEQRKAAFGHLQPRLTASYGDEGVAARARGSGTQTGTAGWRRSCLQGGVASGPPRQGTHEKRGGRVYKPRKIGVVSRLLIHHQFEGTR